jgi:hypothetical protein
MWTLPINSHIMMINYRRTEIYSHARTILMAEVLPLVRLAEPPPAEAAAYRRIRLGSRALVVLFTLLAVGLATLVAFGLTVLLGLRSGLAWVGPSGTYLALTGRGPPDTVPVWTLPLTHRLALVPVILARTAPQLGVLLSLRRLFQFYARGIVFARGNTRQLKLLALWLAADAVIPFVLHLIQAATRIEIDRAWLHVASLQELVLGGLVYVIAEVMRVGYEIEQERGGFV